MDTEQRRQQLLALLKKEKEPITGAELSRELDVSRQVIVQDVAVLRARQENIMATPQGYLLLEPGFHSRPKRTLVCRHQYEDIDKELRLIVENGGVVIDVVVEHQLYGELKAPLMIRTAKDVDDFMKKMETTKAKPLSNLTGGVHLHTVEADTEEALDAIEKKLKEAGVLVSRIDKGDALV